MLNVWCYTSIDSAQRALQTNDNIFSNFKLVLEILAEKRKNIQMNTKKYSNEYKKIFKWIRKNIQMNREAWILIKVQRIMYISMDLTRQALQTNVKVF